MISCRLSRGDSISCWTKRVRLARLRTATDFWFRNVQTTAKMGFLEPWVDFCLRREKNAAPHVSHSSAASASRVAAVISGRPACLPQICSHIAPYEAAGLVTALKSTVSRGWRFRVRSLSGNRVVSARRHRMEGEMQGIWRNQDSSCLDYVSVSTVVETGPLAPWSNQSAVGNS